MPLKPVPLPPCTPQQKALAEQHLDFVYWLVSKFIEAHESAWRFREDLEQAGMMGLVESCIRFKPGGYALTTFAERHIYGRVREQWHRACQLVPAQRLGTNGSGGYAPMLSREGLGAMAHQAAPGLEEAIEQEWAAQLLADAPGQIVRRLGSHIPNPERTAEAFLANLTLEQTDSQAASLYGVARSRVGQIRQRGRKAFEEWARELRAEQ